MSIFNYIECAFGFLIVYALGYHGSLGITAWKLTRIPFVLIGGFFLSIAMNGVPQIAVKEEEDEENQDEIANVQAPDERGKVDDATSPFLWTLKGLTPETIKNQCVSQVVGNPLAPDEDEYGPIYFPNRESLIEFEARKKAERIA